MLQIPLLRIATTAFILLTLAVSTANAKSILGWIERAKFLDGDVIVEAKLDTGADNSSLNAPDPEAFDKNGDEWVRFKVSDSDGNKHTIERPVERMVRIRSASGTSRRYVVKMTICVGDVQREVEVNLADRDGLSYEMLIGRSFLEDNILVDSGPKHTRDPACSEADELDKNGDGQADDDEDRTGEDQSDGDA